MSKEARYDRAIILGVFTATQKKIANYALIKQANLVTYCFATKSGSHRVLQYHGLLPDYAELNKYLSYNISIGFYCRTMISELVFQTHVMSLIPTRRLSCETADPT